MYAYIAGMSSNDKRSSEKYGDISQLTNWILDSGATCHMTPEVFDFIPGKLEDTDKYIEIADRHHATEKQKGQVQIQMCDDNGKSFIATLHNVLLELVPSYDGGSMLMDDISSVPRTMSRK